MKLPDSRNDARYQSQKLFWEKAFGKIFKATNSLSFPQENHGKIAIMIAVDLYPIYIASGFGFKEMMNFFDPTFEFTNLNITPSLYNTFMRTHLPNLFEQGA